MVTELEIARASRELVEFGATVDNRDALARGLFELLQRQVGFDSAAVMRMSDGEWRCYHKPPADSERASLYNTEAMVLEGISRCYGGVVVDTDVLTVRQRERLHVYDEYLRPLGVESLALMYIRRHGVVTSIVGMSRYGTGRFEERHASVLKALQPTLTLIMDRDEALRETAPEPAVPLLSSRERQLVELVCRGLQNREIGAVLGTSGFTVRNQLSHLYEKLEVTNRTELVRRAVELRLVAACG